MRMAELPHPERSRRIRSGTRGWATPSSLRAEGPPGHTAEQREMRVPGDPVLADAAARQRHGGAARPLIGPAVLVKAGRIPHRHAGGGEAVGRDDAAEGAGAPAKVRDERPDL